MNAQAFAPRATPEIAKDVAIANALSADGYCLVTDAIAPGRVEALARDLDPLFAETSPSIGAFYGENTKRFHGLLARSAHMAEFVTEPAILGAVQQVLGPFCDRIQLNLTQAIEIMPGGEAQPPHRDQDMWPLRVAGAEYLVNVMWPFVPYRADNGATTVWPGSHRRLDEILIAEDEAVAIDMDPGAALIFLGSTLHRGGSNSTALPRRGMIVSYSLGWLKPYELPWLAYPPEVAATFDEELAALAGYRAHRPNLGTYEGRCPSLLLKGGDLGLGAIDALRPEQEHLIGLYRAGALQPGAFAVPDSV